MMRAAFVLVALAAVCCVGLVACEGISYEEQRIDLFVRLNDWRYQQGKSQVFNNSALMNLAQHRVEGMADKLSLQLDSGKSIEEEMKEYGYLVVRWTLDAVQGVVTAEQALIEFISNDGSRTHLLDFFVREAGVGYSPEAGRWVVVLARRKAECGNGIVQMEEECDDGNTADDDCCSSECMIESGCTCSVSGQFNPTSVCHHVTA